MTTDDKFKRFLAMTDRPEDFSDEELKELVRDPELAAWYAALSATEEVRRTRGLFLEGESLAGAREVRAATPLRHRRGARRAGWVVSLLATAAVLVVAFLLWPESIQEETPAPTAHETQGKPENASAETPHLSAPVDQPLMAQQTRQEHHATIQKAEGTQTIKGVDEPLQEKITGLTIVPTSADLGPGVTMRLGVHCPMPEGAEPLSEEEPPSPIPADKQALADIYLAEVALQVAYEQRAQAEALRTYAASITGEETPEPIIAF